MWQEFCDKIILQELDLIHLILHLLKKFHNVIVLIKSVVKKNESEYCYDIFLRKGSCKDKHNAEYFHMNVCVL